MNVLDLDLDLFVTNPMFPLAIDGRADSDETQPWTEEMFRCFLEHQCGLSTDNPIPGRIGRHHDEALKFWQEGIEQATLKSPFAVAHADAHSDLGYGPAGWKHLICDFIDRPREERLLQATPGPHIDYANYLAYAVAAGLVSNLTWIHHPEEWNEAFSILFRDFDPHAGYLEIPHCEEKALDAWVEAGYSPKEDWAIGATKRARPIPWRMVSVTDFHTSSDFDLAFMSQSPGFTPRESDSLLEVFTEYISVI